ncbi:MAG: hypothetical protein JO328_12790 [Hyphomicrobiales bacterium]|nr:hypothetical protein [Hyphomicrobiales bacterium]
MAVSLGKNFRRLLAQVLAADEDEMRALIERLLPRGADGKRVLRLQHEGDRPLLPLAIVAALSAGAITGDEAEELKRQARSAEVRPLWRDDYPPELLLISPLERARLGYVHSPEFVFPPWRATADRDRDAAKTGAAIVNNNENTMAAAGEITAWQKPNPL